MYIRTLICQVKYIYIRTLICQVMYIRTLVCQGHVYMYIRTLVLLAAKSVSLPQIMCYLTHRCPNM